MMTAILLLSAYTAGRVWSLCVQTQDTGGRVIDLVLAAAGLYALWSLARC